MRATNPIRVGASIARARSLGAASLYALSVALLVTAMGGAARAQSAAPASQEPAATADTQTAGEATISDQEGEDIIVTGFRAAIANSIAEKRRSNQIVESISAEDIGKLPDNSIAESIARLPGVTSQRVDGRDQAISVRGTQPDFTTTLLNGREQVSTNDNRSVEFDQYPSELLGQVVVYKTPFAGLIGQGIAGTIDLRTIRPLQYGKRVFAANGRGELVTKGGLNAETNNKGYRVSGTYIDQFANDTIGIIVGIAHNSSPTQYERFNAWGYPTFDCGQQLVYQVAGGGACNATYAAAQGKYVIGGAKSFVQSNRLTRTGAIGSIEWAPSSEFTSTLDLMYTRFKEEQVLRGIEMPFYWGRGEVLDPTYTVEGDTIVSGTWNGVKGVVRNDYIERNAKSFAAGWNGKYASDGWTLVGDLSYSRVTRKDVYIETYAGTSRGTASRATDPGPFDTVGFQTQPDGITKFNTVLDYTDPDLIKLTSPNGWSDGPRPNSVPGGQDGFYSSPAVKDKLYSVRGSARREFDDGNGIELGGNFTSRTKSYVPTELFIAATANVNDPAHNTSVLVPPEYRFGTTPLTFLGIPGQVSFDAKRLLADGFFTLLEAPNQNVPARTWQVEEKVATGWLRYDFDAAVGGSGALTGNVGAQLVHTDQSASGFRAQVGLPSLAVVDGIKYTELLPSMSLSFRFDDKNVLRVGIARTLTRARMDQLNASFTFNYNAANVGNPNPLSSYFSANGGNAQLRPWVADSVDISFEHYFNRSAYFALAGFYKYLENYIYESTTLFDFTGIPTGLPAGTVPATYLGAVRQPVNGSGGVMYGTEVSLTLPFNGFIPALDGFGALGSYSYTKSTVTNPNSPGLPLPGLSKHVASGTLFFEKSGFSARGSVRYRSGFLAEVISLGPGARNRMARAEMIVDGQVSYEFQKGPLKGLGILVQGQNLTSEPFVTEDSGNGLIIDSQDYGRRFLAGLSYKF